MNTKRTKLPQYSMLQAEKEFKHIDSYQLVVTDPGKKIDIIKTGRLFFMAAPGWVNRLFALRNRMVQLIGLKVPGTVKNRRALIESFTGKPGEQIGLFRVVDKSANELLLGEDDKHLDFRVSLLLEDMNASVTDRYLTISTAVRFHNGLGRLYFIPVKPFHRLIVRSMLKEMGRAIQADKYR